MDDYQKTSLWQRTLARREGGDEDAEPRERLRVGYLRFRDNVKLVAAEIQRELPEFTIHGIAHIDALWGIASTIIGEDYKINPAEAFVLGGAFLIHDLGMALATYPGRRRELEQTIEWKDALATRMSQELGRAPTKEKLKHPTPDARQQATYDALRALHPERAERLVKNPLSPADGGAEFHLLDDSELRDCFAWYIGRIARSHGWSVEELPAEFRDTRGAPADAHSCYPSK